MCLLCGEQTAPFSQAPFSQPLLTERHFSALKSVIH